MRRKAMTPLLATVVTTLGCGESPPLGTCTSEPEEVSITVHGSTTLERVRGSVRLEASGQSECGSVAGPFSWSSADPSVARVAPIRIIQGSDTSFSPREAFVQATGFGTAEIRAETDGVTGSATFSVVRPPTRAEGMTLLGGDSVPRVLTDLWLSGDYAYTGTEIEDCAAAGVPCEDLQGTVITWRLGADGIAHPVDSVVLPGPRANDVKVSPDGSFLVVSQEVSPTDNGIVILSLADPARPTLVAHYTDDLDNGVHNVWVERIDGTDFVFAVESGGGQDAGLHVIDVSNPTAPNTVALWRGGPSTIHDVYVRDGLAFVSHWDDGLVIVDVGNGIAGGSPDSPEEVGRVTTPRGNVHNAWYWPAAELVFVGEEEFPQPGDTLRVGELRVVDVSDMTAPRIVASYGIPGETPHNFWVDEENEVLYAAWYDRGLRAFDVSGDLPADLSSREIGWVQPSGSRGLARIWAPQLHRGRVYLSDPYHGIWVVDAVR